MAAPMRIALFSGNYNYVREGANQALNRLVGHLEAEGHAVRVYSPVTDTPAFAPTGTLIPVPSVTLPLRGEFQLALGLSRALRDDIRAFAPDLFHVSTPDILGFSAQRFAKSLGRPIVASLHTLFETYPEHYGMGWTRPAIEALLHRFYRRSDCVLVPTPALREEMLAIRGGGPVNVWSRGVDRTLFDPARRDLDWRRAQGWADDDVVLLFFGRLVAEKGVDDFVSVVRRLQQTNPKLRSLIVGAGPAAGRFEGLPGALLAGHLEGEGLARAVASADILLHPSTTESFGNVLLEAMAAGVAVVSADARNARTLIDDGISGLLCDPADLASYGDAVSGLVASPERRLMLGAAARRASEAYSWDAASSSVAQAYRETIADR